MASHKRNTQIVDINFLTSQTKKKINSLWESNRCNQIHISMNENYCIKNINTYEYYSISYAIVFE